MAEDHYHSRFGGLWTDRSDALDLLAQRVQDGQLDVFQADLVEHWITKGYVIIPGAVPEELCDALAADLADVWANGSDTALVQDPSAAPGTGARVTPDLNADRMRLVDLYGCSRPALEILTHPSITGFLEIVFGTPPLLFQGLTFEKGSQQGLHQDTAYVVVDRPLELAASWVALEDVTEGSGELMYLEGSHRLPDYEFSGERKHWDPGRDGQEQHDDWSRWIIRRSEELGFRRRTFLPRKGDVLLWSADLAHGGVPVEDPELTRRSIVGHYCPASRNPHYFSFIPGRVKAPFRGAFVSSGYYDIARLPSPDSRAGRTGAATADERNARRVADRVSGSGIYGVPMNLQRLYEYRFKDIDQGARDAVWKEIAPFIWSRYGSPTAVLDPAAGIGEFIANVPADDRWAVDLVDHGLTSVPGVTTRIASFFDAELPAEHFGMVFASNLMEHLASPDEIAAFVERSRELLVPGGRLVLMGPNFKYCADEYFDCADHVLPLTHVSMAEHLYAGGLEVDDVVARFLPYSFRSRLPQSAALVRRYLDTPLAWKVLGKQFMVAGRK